MTLSNSILLDSITFGCSSPLRESRFMLKPEVVSNPRLYLEYLKSDSNLISDGSVDSNCRYGSWKEERSGATACVFVGRSVVVVIIVAVVAI